MNPSTESALYDIVIVGGGPAGYTAGLYAARAGLKALLIAGQTVPLPEAAAAGLARFARDGGLVVIDGGTTIAVPEARKNQLAVSWPAPISAKVP